MESTRDIAAHRQRGRGRKAFWIIVWAAVIAGVIYTLGTP